MVGSPDRFIHVCTQGLEHAGIDRRFHTDGRIHRSQRHTGILVATIPSLCSAPFGPRAFLAEGGSGGASAPFRIQLYSCLHDSRLGQGTMPNDECIEARSEATSMETERWSILLSLALQRKLPRNHAFSDAVELFCGPTRGEKKRQARILQDRGETERAPVRISPISRGTGPLAYEHPRRQLDESTSRKLAGTAERLTLSCITPRAFPKQTNEHVQENLATLKKGGLTCFFRHKKPPEE